MISTFSNARLLLVEDDIPKRKAISSYLNEKNIGLSIDTAESLSTAIKKVGGEKYWIAIIDMSIPTYDILKDKEGGGQPQNFGGTEVLRFLESESPETYPIVITQYKEFSGPGMRFKSLDDLRNDLLEEFSGFLYDVIYYSGSNGDWKNDLDEVIDNLIKAAGGDEK
ncbi:hypothetical protein [Vreelandella olivaria]|uniref:hypothetical protein n=1 Tax=Vreelandella olivaria TaxID=390919 RepID=UPI00201FAD2D|nr:hypothetical protein [Halomonas olivaria]